MPNVYEFDFTNAEPKQGGAKYDRVPEGLYRAQAVAWDKSTSGAGRTVHKCDIEIIAGPYKGKKVGDNFSMARPNTDDKLFGLQRLHAMLIACGFKQFTGRQKLDLDKALRRPFDVEIRDDEMPADEEQGRKARTISRPVAYYRKGTKQANGAAPAEQAKATAELAAPAAAAVAEPEDEEPETPDPGVAAAADDDLFDD